MSSGKVSKIPERFFFGSAISLSFVRITEDQQSMLLLGCWSVFSAIGNTWKTHPYFNCCMKCRLYRLLCVFLINRHTNHTDGGMGEELFFFPFSPHTFHLALLFQCSAPSIKNRVWDIKKALEGTWRQRRWLKQNWERIDKDIHCSCP